MNDPARVRFGKGAGYLNGDVERLAQIERLALNQFGESFALDLLHHDEAPSLVFPDFVNCANVRVVKFGGGASFSDQPLLRTLVQRRFDREKLYGHLAVELSVFCEVYLSHPASAELLDNSVVRDERVD